MERETFNSPPDSATEFNLDCFLRAVAALTDAAPGVPVYYLHPNELAFWDKMGWIEHRPDGKMIALCPYEPAGYEVCRQEPMPRC